MNTSGINNLQNQYALYSGSTSNTTTSTNTTSTVDTQNTVSSTADTVTLSAEALALQATIEEPPITEEPPVTPNYGGGYSARPPR
ncbi:MAG TPA: hypothetical protein DF774_09370 [Rheinheimera sp.]|uniref:hypothetical protein n=1 Tax=Rheinheimera sp. TaxID=1869214 RepID=UPI000EF0B8F0|nr:hypothetical protein [Rheinheimera sp.]HCU65955.1 hypothetical protein [Rheinheimera sp.]